MVPKWSRKECCFRRHPPSSGKRCGYRECARGIKLLLADLTFCFCSWRRAGSSAFLTA